MKNNKGWNNTRRNTMYWVSVLLLLLVAVNIVTWFRIERTPVIETLFYGLIHLYETVIPVMMANDVQYILLSLLTIVIVDMIFILSLHYICGSLPNMDQSEQPGQFRYLLKTVMIVDIVLGIILEMYAVRGLRDLRSDFSLTSITMWLYIGMFAFGSYWYWKNVLNIREVINVAKLVKSGENHEETVWYSITNCDERISTFSRVPWCGKANASIIDEDDIVYLGGALKESFFNYLIVLDAKKEINFLHENKIREIAVLPHAKILVVVLGENETFSSLLDYLGNTQNATVIRNTCIKNIGKVNIRYVIDEYVSNKEGKRKQHPLRLSESEIYQETYLKIGKSPQLCVSFMKMITSSLEVLPAIYALFDFIDLQYRLSIARIIDPQYSKQLSWMKDKSRIIGNIGIMSRIIEGKILRQNAFKNSTLSYHELFENIIAERDMELIKKYLSNYEKDFTKPVWATIVYLTYSLRNVLRGHGTFDKADAFDLYNVVFKLAVLNVFILESNEIYLETSESVLSENGEMAYYYVYGQYKDEVKRTMSPFLAATRNGNILVFNNWNKSKLEKGKGSIEYINYLDGTLILPEYKHIDL